MVQGQLVTYNIVTFAQNPAKFGGTMPTFCGSRKFLRDLMPDWG
jgi:hypothetical protein